MYLALIFKLLVYVKSENRKNSFNIWCFIKIHLRNHSFHYDMILIGIRDINEQEKMEKKDDYKDFLLFNDFKESLGLRYTFLKL